jgi:flavin-dependent dehydrogenase
MALGAEKRVLERKLSEHGSSADSGLKLENGSRVAVVGGGPAGSFFSYFLMDMARMLDLDVQVDVYEPRDYTRSGPASCNTCGGIVSESLVQILATEGINLPDSVVQRGIDSYVLHTAGSREVPIDRPLSEKRIAAVHRGAGPRGIKKVRWQSFDGYLQELTIAKGANVIKKRVDGFAWEDGLPQVTTRDAGPQTYDLLVVAVGVNTGLLKAFDEFGLDYKPPETSRTYISEFFLGQDLVEKHLGSAMHVFLLDIPRVKFSALIPKGDYVTLCLLGQDIDAQLVRAFMEAPEVRRCFPSDWGLPEDFCHCSPRISMNAAVQPFADRLVFIGDCGVTRLYKDGIGAAYRTGKAAAVTVALEGISSEDFRRHYWPLCRTMENDNRIGKLILGFTSMVKKVGCTRRGVVRMVSKEQSGAYERPHMSSVLWDVFTGSAPYRDIFKRTLHPAFLSRFLWNSAISVFPFAKGR